jgi:pilus assembly protein Flp/PilA
VSILRRLTHQIFHQEDGQTLIEYSLIISLIALTAVGGLTLMGGEVDGLYGVLETVADAMSGGT